MPDLDQLLDDLVASPPDGLTLERRGRGGFTTLPNARTQQVDVSTKGGDVVFMSPIARSSVIPEKGEFRAKFLRRLWEINACVDLVRLTLDRHDRLVGRARHPLGTLDPEELGVYVQALVVVCDRLEWVLTGEDRY